MVFWKASTDIPKQKAKIKINHLGVSKGNSNSNKI